ncbi:MAG: hypothetical protein IPK16_11335 [Anaerolineales bacterium]|nr:hypothetical protein [Anaerolineales bacterium]
MMGFRLFSRAGAHKPRKGRYAFVLTLLAASLVVVMTVLLLLGTGFVPMPSRYGLSIVAKEAYYRLPFVDSSSSQAQIGNSVSSEQPLAGLDGVSVLANGPLRVSSTNPRYFADGTGKIVYLTGSHFWLNFQDGLLTDPPPAFDYVKHLDFLQARGHNFFRLWNWEQAKWSLELSGDSYFSPMPFQRTGPGTALDGKPKFDLPNSTRPTSIACVSELSWPVIEECMCRSCSSMVGAS